MIQFTIKIEQECNLKNKTTRENEGSTSNNKQIHDKNAGKTKENE